MKVLVILPRIIRMFFLINETKLLKKIIESAISAELKNTKYTWMNWQTACLFAVFKLSVNKGIPKC